MVEDETGYGSLSSGWGNPLKIALVSAPTCPPLGNPRPCGHQLIGSGGLVGKRASQAGDKGFQVVEANLPHSRQNDRRSGSEQFVRCCQVPFVPELLSLWDLKGDRGLAGRARSVPWQQDEGSRCGILRH